MTLHESEQLVSVGDGPNQPATKTSETLLSDGNSAGNAQRGEARLGRTKHGRCAPAILHHLAGDNLLTLAFGALVHSVRVGLTTQAQRPGARDATIATATPPPGSLQRMVRPRAHHLNSYFATSFG